MILTLTLSLYACNGSSNVNENEVPTSQESSSADEPESPTSQDSSYVDETEAPAPPESPCVIESLTVTAEKNPGIYEDIIADVTNNTITLKAGLLCDTYALKNALIDVVTDGVSYTVAGTVYTPGNEEGLRIDLTAGESLTLTDADGLKRVYDVVLSYAEKRIPVIHVNTSDGADITTKEKYSSATITIDAEGVDGWYLPEGYGSLEATSVGIKGRGNSTWGWAKKPYKIKFDEKTEILGMTEAKKWVLLANYADYSLIRNYVVFEGARSLSNELSPLHQFPVNLFLNGNYLGVYTLGEDKEVKEGRIELPENNGQPDTSFLLELYGTEEGDVFDVNCFHSGDIKWCKIQYPEDDLTVEQTKFIKDFCFHIDQDVYFGDEWEEHVDMDSFVNWFIASELFFNPDGCFRRSCFLTKEPGGKLKMGPLWDFDLGVGNIANYSHHYESWLCNTQSSEVVPQNWFTVFLEDEDFRSRLREVWDEKKDLLLETTLASVDKMGETLVPSAEYNFTVWNVLGTRAVPHQPSVVEGFSTYEENVEYLRNFIINRWNWLDANI